MTSRDASSLRILITGRDRRVGSALVHALGDHGEVIAPSRRDLDMAVPHEIRRIVRTEVPDVLINTGACRVGPEASPDSALAVCAHAPRSLGEEAERLGIPLVHFSTDRVFDGRGAEPYLETDEPSPMDVTGRAQVLGDRAVGRSGAPHLILRVGWVFGARDLERARGDVSVAEVPWGPQVGNPTWSHHVAAATLQALVSIGGGLPLSRDRLVSGLRSLGGLYHVSAGGVASLEDFVEAMSVPDARHPAGPTRNRRLDAGKLGRELGVRLPNWEVGLEDCLEHEGRMGAIPVA